MMSTDLGSFQSEHVRVSKSLNESESKYVRERKLKIEKCLQNNGINCQEADVPHIAVLASGGGERAMVGLLGCLDQMGQDNLLDSALYLFGLSGSTWCMSLVYEDPVWSSNLLITKDKLIKRLTETSVEPNTIIKWLTEAVKFENYSLTDFGSAAAAYYYFKAVDRSRLSEQKQRDTTNPYPIYTATENGLKQRGFTADCWFEFSPHEAGYSHVGAFVDTAMFGSQFEAGVLKQKMEERDMLYLQGLCGSALADGKENKENIQQMIWDRIKVFFGQRSATNNEMSSSKSELAVTEVASGGSTVAVASNWRVPCDCQACTFINILLQIHDNPEDEFMLEKLRQFQTEISSQGHPSVLILEKETWKKMATEERDKYLADLTKSLDGLFSGACDVSAVGMKTLPVVYSWTWGTHSNFLFKYPAGEGKVPDMLLSAEHIYLEDAGFVINAPYVAALRAERKVDLILSFDFSAGDPFLTVNLAAEYCKESGIPFPPVDVPEEEKENPKDFYVFKGEQGPTVIHMPLFNIVNCGGDVNKWRETYSTFQLPFTREMIQDLLRVSSLNVANNKKRILEEIQALCQRQ